MSMTEQTISRSAATTAGDDGAAAALDFDVEVPDDVRDQAEMVMDRYRAALLESTETFPHRLQQWQDQQEAQGVLPQGSARIDPQTGEPILPGGYQYWNCLLAGPFQFFGNPPYRPGNIIAAGELALFVAVIWINPANGPGGGLPGTIVLGDRDYRACFETVNVTDVADGPDFTASGTFGSPANVVTLIPWFFVAPDPGAKPRIYETNFAVDVTVAGQPFAAMATWHLDPNGDPGFLFVPPVPAQLQHDIPARYLVYRR